MKFIAFIISQIIQKINFKLGEYLFSHLPAGYRNFNVVVKFRNIKLKIFTGESTGRRIYYYNNFETRQIDAFMFLLKPGMLFFDIGANIGIYSLIAASSNVYCVAFEPSGSIVKKLKENIFLNNFAPLIKVVPEAVWDEKNDVKFIEYRANNFGVGKILAKNNDENRDIVEVKTNTIDYYATNYGRPDIIKMDIEGAEIKAIKGGQHLLAQNNAPILMIEIHSELLKEYGGTLRQCVEGIKAFGYNMWEIKGVVNLSNYTYVFSKNELDSSFFTPL